MKAFLTITVLVVLFSSTISCSEGCGIGWRRNRNKCYLLINQLALNWINSLDFCRSLGGRLAVPKNEREHQFLKRIGRHSGKSVIWIGVADLIVEGKWLTFPDTWHAKYVNWGNREPNGGARENCVQMVRRYDYRWNDQPCSSVFNFICEKAK